MFGNAAVESITVCLTPLITDESCVIAKCTGSYDTLMRPLLIVQDLVLEQSAVSCVGLTFTERSGLAVVPVSVDSTAEKTAVPATAGVTARLAFPLLNAADPNGSPPCYATIERHRAGC